MKFKYLFLAAVLALIASGVYAGLQESVPVDVDLDNMRASGDMVTARYSSNKDERIGCGARYFDDGVSIQFSFAFCSARDQDGDDIVCFTENPDLVDVIGGISDYSFLTFQWNEDEECTFIGFSTQSFYLPRGLNANGNNGKGGMGN